MKNTGVGLAVVVLGPFGVGAGPALELDLELDPLAEAPLVVVEGGFGLAADFTVVAAAGTEEEGAEFAGGLEIGGAASAVLTPATSFLYWASPVSMRC